MEPLFDPTAPQEHVELSVNSDLLNKCAAMDINCDSVFEQALTEQLAKATGDQWVDENKKAIGAYNEFAEKYDCFSDEFRVF